MLVSAKEMLTKAKAGKYAVGQFNINNLEWTKSILQAQGELVRPVALKYLQKLLIVYIQLTEIHAISVKIV